MINAALLSLRFDLHSEINCNAFLSSLSYGDNYLRHSIDGKHIAEESGLKELVNYANTFFIVSASSECTSFDYEIIANDIAKHIETFYKNVTKGLYDFLIRKDIVKVDFFKPRFHYSPHTSSFGVTFYYTLQYATGSSFLYAYYYLPDATFSDTVEIQKYLSTLLKHNTRSVFCDNGDFLWSSNNANKVGYSFVIGGTEENFIERNFNIKTSAIKSGIVCPGILSACQKVIKSRSRFTHLKHYIFVEPEFVACSIESKKWEKEFLYFDYLQHAFIDLSFYNSASDLVGQYQEILASDLPSQLNDAKQASLIKTLVWMKRRKKINYNKVIEQSMAVSPLTVIQNIASIGGAAYGGYANFYQG